MDKQVHFVSCFFFKVLIHVDTLYHPTRQQTVSLPLFIVLHTVRGCIVKVREGGSIRHWHITAQHSTHTHKHTHTHTHTHAHTPHTRTHAHTHTHTHKCTLFICLCCAEILLTVFFASASSFLFTYSSEIPAKGLLASSYAPSLSYHARSNR